MKTIIYSTKLFRGHVICCSLIFITAFTSFLQAGNILNVSSIKISKDYPASFVLDLTRNDIVTVKYSKTGGNADLNQLLVQVIDLNQQEEVVVASFNRSGRDFLAAYDGKYRIDFIYNGSGGLLRQRYMNLALDFDLEGFDGLEKGESMEVLHATNCVIENSEENAFKLRYYLTEGDKITISSTDSKAAFLKLKVTQLAKMFSVSGSTVITIPADGTYSFNFYLDGEDDQSLLNLRELLSRDDVLFRDLSIYRERAVDFAAMIQSNSPDQDPNSSSDPNNPDAENTEENSEADAYGQMLEMMSDGNKSRDEMNQAVLEAMKLQQERMDELINRKNIRTEIYSFPNDITLKLEPEFNFSSNNENRKCEPITLTPSNFNIWFYWVGVGENAEESFEIHNEEIERSFKKPLSDAAAEYIYGKFTGANVGRRNPTFPNESQYSQYLFEDAEYAIVDEFNMQRFLKGQRYSKLNQSAKNSKFITSDNGISSRPTGDTELYFCACNNNKATPVNIYFKFFTIEYDEIEY